MHSEAVAGLDFDQHVKGRRCTAFEHGLLRTTAAGFFIGESHGFDTTDKIAERGVKQEVI